MAVGESSTQNFFRQSRISNSNMWIIRELGDKTVDVTYS